MLLLRRKREQKKRRIKKISTHLIVWTVRSSNLGPESLKVLSNSSAFTGMCFSKQNTEVVLWICWNCPLPQDLQLPLVLGQPLFCFVLFYCTFFSISFQFAFSDLLTNKQTFEWLMFIPAHKHRKSVRPCLHLCTMWYTNTFSYFFTSYVLIKLIQVFLQ